MAAAVLVLAMVTAAAPATAEPITVLQRSCLHPDDAELAAPWIAQAPGGLVVELWCGTRVEVSGGICRIRRGTEVTEVPCTEP